MKCEGCENIVPATQIHECAECGRNVCENCGTRVQRPESSEEDDSGSMQDAWLCDGCWHCAFGTDDDEDDTSGGA